MKILIAGDSFSADWTKKYPDGLGWPNLLSQRFDVHNVSQAGCSEYRIYKQINSVELNDYDYVIISHTSPYRIYTDYNPLRSNDKLHHHCDLLYSDCKNLAIDNKEYKAVSEYFEKFFSLEFAEYVYQLIRQDINRVVDGHKVLNISHLKTPVSVDIDFFDEYSSNPGHINHYNDIGNKNVFNCIVKRIQSWQ